ncbi:MAG: transcription termination factor NusA [Anaerolineae bacterium]|nr:transcription termination factor NusA [Anaerolineae bacterium]
MSKELIMAVNQICAEKELPRETILGAIEEALVHAYRRNYANATANVQATIDPNTGDLSISCEKTVVEKVEDPAVEIGLPEARKLDKDAELGSTVIDHREPADFGRIAAQTAKQVILQRIHEAERDQLFDFYKQREGELITGQVQSIDYRSNAVTVTLSKKAEGIIAAEDQLPNDRYRVGMNVRTLLAEINKGTRGPQIRLSRTHRNMLRRLLEREIPEIYSGTVEIKSIAREPGQRSKVAVSASQPGVDPVGSCVGLRGTRIQNIVDELNGEKIDVVEWSADVRSFISNALSPAKPTDTILIEEGDIRTAIVVVPDRQLSLAIGKEGQNARLAAKLTGWRIDIKSETEAATEGLAEIKRQQMQMIRQRSLQDKAAALPAGDDLLSRAEWLLRERDKTQATLETAARLLAQADQNRPDLPQIEEEAEAQPETEMVEAEAAAPEVAEAVAPAVEEEEVAAEPGPAEVAPAEPEPQSMGDAGEQFLVPEAFVDDELIEDEEEGGAGKKAPAKKVKKDTKKRELVFDEDLGEVVARRKRKPGRGGWGDVEY